LTNSAYDIDAIPNFATLPKAIHEADEMFNAARALLPTAGEPWRYYFHSGWLMTSRMETFLRQINRPPEERTLLDFACGYGRLTRYFARTFKSVTCSDLEQSMLDFNRKHHGCDGFRSQLDPEAVEWPATKFDVVFSFSLFTHLPPESWATWFWSLFDTVKTDGLFIITTRPVSMAARGKEVIGSGDLITYTLRNETRGRIPLENYGSTTLRTKFIDDVVYSQPDRIERVAMFPAGTMDQYQDTHVFKRIS